MQESCLETFTTFNNVGRNAVDKYEFNYSVDMKVFPTIPIHFPPSVSDS